ncbi:MAG: sigma-70 family RNA polymerase sigma factor [Bacteroidia bacterium]|nr:sigma-70 family RNA polymerase sigma factor [Bacteroidia bacterium]
MLRSVLLRTGGEGVIDAAARGSWRELEAKLRPFVARRVHSMVDVDDVVQDVFLRMQRGLGGLRDEERFGPWVYQVARSAIADHQRAQAKYGLADASAAEEAPVESEDGERSVEQVVASYLAPFVAMLPSPYREALTLTELEGLTQKQAAEMLGISLSGMKSRVQRGRVQLRQALEDCCLIALDVRGQVVSCVPRPDGKLPNGVETSQFLPTCCSSGDRRTKAPTQLAPARSFWMRSDVENTDAWTEKFSTAELDDLSCIVASLAGRKPESLTRDALPKSGPIDEAARRWRWALERGLGFLLVRGLDVNAMSLEELTLSYAVLGLHLGSFVPQNLRGELLTNIRDTGADPNLPSTRLYMTRAEQDFHTDGADIIGLLCRRTSRSGGASRIVSSGAIVREIQRARPDLYPVLFEDFPWRYQEEGTPPIILTRPICTVTSKNEQGALLNTFFIPWYIRRSQELPDTPRLTPAQAAAIEEIKRLANDPRFYLDMTFEPGDVQWLKNAAILHKRTAYEDFDEPERKRHLLRLWLSAPDFGDGDAQLRAGITKELSR